MTWETFGDPACCTRAQLEEEARAAERVAKAYRDELALRPDKDVEFFGFEWNGQVYGEPTFAEAIELMKKVWGLQFDAESSPYRIRRYYRRKSDV